MVQLGYAGRNDAGIRSDLRLIGKTLRRRTTLLLAGLSMLAAIVGHGIGG